MNKNDEFEIVIEDLNSDGEGIGRANGYALFVKDALVGDKVRVKVIKAKKNYGYARLMEIITPSPYRVEPKCPIARQCGGCQLQHLSYEKQLEFKQNKVANCLKRIGKFEGMESIMEPILGMEYPYYYRNKAQFPVGRDKEGKVIAGFYAGRSHSIIETSHCCIQSEVNDEILKRVRKYIADNHLEPYDEDSHRGVVRHILTRVGFITGEIMVCLIINGDKLPFQEKLVQSLKEIPGMTSISFNVNKERTNVILGNRVVTLWGQEYITDSIGDVKYRISPLSFYQVNPVQTAKLYETALEFAGLSRDEVVWDLYCGIGTISLFLAKRAKMVYGVEIVPQAVDDARVNAEINGIGNAEFIVGAAEEVLPEKYKEDNVKADVIVVDPPRKGCEEALLETIVRMEPHRVVYVSCDPATLARDLRFLCDRGYELKRIRACDMFGQGVHVETVVLLSQQRA